MKRTVYVLLALSALTACHRGSKAPAAPTGQVAATAAGQEITTSDIRMEMGGVADDPQAAANAQPAALQAIVNRKILTAAAVERGLDKTPVSAMQLNRARELALIQMLQQSIVARVPKPSPEEANIYIRDNPASFAQRKLISVDQVVVPQITQAIARQLQPLTQMDQIIALLDTNKVPYRLGGAVIDTVGLEPAPAKQISAMPVGFVFLTPAGGGGVQISKVTGSRAAPLAGPTAVQAAQQFIFNRRVGEQLKTQFEAILKAGQAKVQVNPAFRAPAARPSGAPAPAASARPAG